MAITGREEETLVAIIFSVQSLCGTIDDRIYVNAPNFVNFILIYIVKAWTGELGYKSYQYHYFCMC